MIHTKRVIFMILPLMFVPLVYGLSSPSDACAVPPDPNFGSEPRCSWDMNAESYRCCWGEGDKLYCQDCTPTSTDGVNITWDCNEKEEQPSSVQQPPTIPTPPTGGKGLFGSNVLPTPSISPEDGGVVEQPPLTPTEPVAPLTVLPPEGDQGNDEEDGSEDGGGKPPKGLLPETGIEEQPEVQQPKEGPSNEGQGPAGPLT